MTPASQEVLFPLLGWDTSDEMTRQRPGTTPKIVNARSIDPSTFRFRGGGRPGHKKYPLAQSPAGTTVIQAVGQISICTEEAAAAVFQDYTPAFIADPTEPARNPNSRKIPPFGSAVPLLKNWPPPIRRQIQLVPSQTSQLNGFSVTLTATLTLQTAGSLIASGPLTLRTNPPGLNGDGGSGTTDGSGVATFLVAEPSFEGPVQYLVANEYTLAGFTFPLIARGICTVFWGPDGDRTITVTSPDGPNLDADGKAHPLVGLLTHGGGVPVPGILVRLRTTPSGRDGDGLEDYTDNDGGVMFSVSDTENETVIYTVRRPSPSSLSGSTSIQWGSATDQFKTAQNVGTSGTVTFDKSVSLGDTLVIAFFWGTGTSPSVASVTDNLGNTYTFAGHTNDPGAPSGPQFSVYWARVTSPGNCTVTVATSFAVPNSPLVDINAACYRKKTAGSPVVKTAFVSYPSPTTVFSDSAGSLGSANQDHLYVGCYFTLGKTSPLIVNFAVSTGFADHSDLNIGTGASVVIADNRNVGADVPSPVDPTVTYGSLFAITRGDFVVTLDFTPDP